ncbi:putative 2-oxo-4-hydroxy-4-carboxy-5-ureidoimidazoline decarboxylase isoform X1 [Balaenoptera acutorostrata]|uniref:2-oxo-4-hydroxy-4-carboxy-5-ureidoimidazoline decarboxylase n=1 Tax=Balaenoptera acutorostrata TaxID=9767 RepID=A0A383YN45_BALAC|nr:putative 2-oxo-4-hydroxy-4-carboxy-5-ureidoimidazoline decarboxylase isoform X1 [Balaenoptera acutorostrata]
MEGREVWDGLEGRVRRAPLASRHPQLPLLTSWDPASLGYPSGRGTALPPACLCFSAGQEGVLRCHPDLAGRELQRGELSAESQREQSAAGLTSLGAAERLWLAELNAQYRARFGFPFVPAARLSDRAAVPSERVRRLHCPPAQELSTTLGEVKKIGRRRLADLLGSHAAEP